MYKQFYQEQRDTNLQRISKYNKQSSILSVVRFIFFIIAVVSFILAFDKGRSYLFIVFAFAIIMFLYLINVHNKVIYNIKYANVAIDNSERYFDRLEDKWMDFKATGEEFYQEGDYLSKDLDLIGSKSLFQFLNQTKSKGGARKLYTALSKGLDNQKYIKKRNDAVNELANNKELYQKLTTLIGMYNSKSHFDYLTKEYTLSDTRLKYYKIIKVLMPLLVVLSLIWTSIDPTRIFSVIAIILVNLLICLVNFQYNRNFLQDLIYKDENIKVLSDLVKEIENEKFNSELLNEYLVKINKHGSATKTLRSLKRLKEKIESMSNGAVYIILEALVVFDYQIVTDYNKWKQNEGLVVNEIIDFFQEIEMLLSLGVINQTRTDSVVPLISDVNTPLIKTTSLAHPLINESKVVTNDFNGEKETLVITGSNMSGKTTFIRTIGINLVLAYAGANVTASNFECSMMKIFTSIRIEDNYALGISTFYAEINRIKAMVEYAKSNKPMLCLIDEIFMGTNSADRIYGASKAIENLGKGNSLVIVTTHDFELTKLDGVKNAHFKEEYENNQIKFDYKMLEGPSTTRNARYLLAMAGIE